MGNTDHPSQFIPSTPRWLRWWGVVVLVLLIFFSAPQLGRLGGDFLLRAAIERIKAQTTLHLAWADHSLVGSSEGIELRFTAPRLSAADGAQVLTARQVRLAVRWRALLSGARTFDHLSIDGLRLQLRRNADGRPNLAVLFAGSGDGRALSLGALALGDARIDWQDDRHAGQLTLSELYAGPVRLTSAGQISLIGLSGQGELHGAALHAPLTWRLDLANLHATPTLVSLARLKLTLRSQPDAVSTGLTFENVAADRASLLIGALRLAGHYRAKERVLRGALTARVQGIGPHWQLDDLAGQVALDDPRLPDTLPFAGQLSFDAAKQRLQGKLRSRYQGAALSGRFDVRRQPFHLRFALEIEHFDLDRWQSKSAPARPSDPLPAWLATLTVEGRLQVGRLRVAGGEAEQVRLQLQGQPGRWLLRQQRGR